MTAARVGDEASRSNGWTSVVVVALLIWLGWQIILGLLVQRAPPEVAVRVAPGSALALSRAAEGEYVAGRVDQARDLAMLSLRAAPFDVRALRVLGQTLTTTDADKADELLTLAGNWSLRDDPSHAWLVERRLRQGDYVGAFGHADVLARRREDLRPVFFRLFATAVALDSRAGPALLQRVAARPVWRSDFLEYLRTLPDGPKVQALLAAGLAEGRGSLSDQELEVIYLDWLEDGRLAGLLELRRQTRRPPPSALFDGDFDGIPAPRPFRWDLLPSAEASVMISTDPDRGHDNSLVVAVSGVRESHIALQVLTLKPGRHGFSWSNRLTEANSTDRLRWTLTCLESGARIFDLPDAASQRWANHFSTFDVPQSRCSVQWLYLESTLVDRSSNSEVWIDQVDVTKYPVK